MCFLCSLLSTQSLLVVLADLLLLGLSSDALDESIGQFAAALAACVDGVTTSFLVPLTKLLYQLIESCRKPGIEGIAVAPACLSPVLPAADTLVAIATKLASSQPDQFLKVGTFLYLSWENLSILACSSPVLVYHQTIYFSCCLLICATLFSLATNRSFSSDF